MLLMIWSNSDFSPSCTAHLKFVYDRVNVSSKLLLLTDLYEEVSGPFWSYQGS